jgi:HAD superfamily hydrolase (TIGR01509 family)
VVIFDCNGVLVDSESLVTRVLSDEFKRAGFALTPEIVARFFTGRRLADVMQDVETAAGRPVPSDFAARVNTAVLERFQSELRATPHAAQALAWVRGPKCVASSSSLERIRATLETTGLIKFFDPHLFSASQVSRGKPAPDLFLHVAKRMSIEPRDCIVVEDSAVGVTAAIAAGMRAIGFVGGSHAGNRLGEHLRSLGASAVIADMRALKSTIIDLRGW